MFSSENVQIGARPSFGPGQTTDDAAWQGVFRLSGRHENASASHLAKNASQHNDMREKELLKSASLTYMKFAKTRHVEKEIRR
jgi:hypothetical protein